MESMDTLHWKIYVLKDEFGRPRYVGKTTGKLRRRLLRHLEEVTRVRKRTHKANWLRKMLLAGIEPTIELVAEGVGPGWQEAEMRHIEIYRKVYGNLITNTTDGGDGALGVKHSEESCRKIAMSHLGRKMSEETRRKMSLARKGVPLGPFTAEHRANLSKAHKGYKHTEAWKKNHAAIMTGKILGPNSWEALQNQRLERIMRKFKVSEEIAKTYPEYYVTPEMIELAVARNSGCMSAAARELRVPINMIRYYDPRKKLNVR